MVTQNDCRRKEGKKKRRKEGKKERRKEEKKEGRKEGKKERRKEKWKEENPRVELVCGHAVLSPACSLLTLNCINRGESRGKRLIG